MKPSTKFTVDQLLNSASDSNGCLAHYNKIFAVIWVMASIGCISFAVDFVIDFHSIRQVTGFLFSSAIHNPLTVAIGLLSMIWIPYALGLPALMILFKKGCAVSVSGEVVKFLDNEIPINKIKYIEKSGTMNGLKLSIVTIDGHIFSYDGIFLRGFSRNIFNTK